MSSERTFPEVGDFVVATVTRVVDYGAYVKLDEYDDTEGLVHISEVSSTWVRNIRDHVRQGQKTVLKVLRVDPQRGQVDVSLRRVTGREKSEKMLEWKREKKADAILQTAAEKLAADEAGILKIRDVIMEKYDTLYSAFEEALEDGEEAFMKMGLDESWAKALTETARSKIRVEAAKVKATIELTCMKPEGIEAIKAALVSAKKVRKGKGVEVKAYAIGSPRYRVEVTAKDYAQAEKVLKEALKEASNVIKSLGGEGRPPI